MKEYSIIECVSWDTSLYSGMQCMATPEDCPQNLKQEVKKITAKETNVLPIHLTRPQAVDM